MLGGAKGGVVGTQRLVRVAVIAVLIAGTLVGEGAISLADGLGSATAHDVAAEDIGADASIVLDDVSAFGTDGGTVIIEPETETAETFDYDYVDPEGSRLVGLNRPNSAAHPAGSFVQAQSSDPSDSSASDPEPTDPAADEPSPASTPSDDSEYGSPSAEADSSQSGASNEGSSFDVGPEACELLDLCQVTLPIDPGCEGCDQLVADLTALFQDCNQTGTCDLSLPIDPGCVDCSDFIAEITALLNRCFAQNSCDDPAAGVVSEIADAVCASGDAGRALDTGCLGHVLSTLSNHDLFDCDPKGVGQSCSELAERLLAQDVCGGNLLGECDDARFALIDDPACNPHYGVCAPPPNPCAHLQDECIPALPDLCRDLNGCLPDAALDLSDIALDDMTLIAGPGSASTSMAPPSSGHCCGKDEDPNSCFVSGSSYKYDEPMKGSNSSVQDETYSTSHAGEYLYAEAYSHASTGRGSATASTQETFIRSRVGGTFSIRGKRAPNIIDLAVSVPYHIRGKLSSSRESVPCPFIPCSLESQALAKATVAVGVRNISQDSDVRQEVIFDESIEGRGEDSFDEEETKLLSLSVEKGQVYAVWVQVRTYASVDPGTTGPLLRSRATADFMHLYDTPDYRPWYGGVMLDYIHIRANTAAWP